PFDHPQLFPPNGHPQSANGYPVDQDPTHPGQAKNNFIEVPATGAKGGNPLPTSLENLLNPPAPVPPPPPAVSGGGATGGTAASSGGGNNGGGNNGGGGGSQNPPSIPPPSENDGSGNGQGAAPRSPR